MDESCAHHPNVDLEEEKLEALRNDSDFETLGPVTDSKDEGSCHTSQYCNNSSGELSVTSVVSRKSTDQGSSIDKDISLKKFLQIDDKLGYDLQGKQNNTLSILRRINTRKEGDYRRSSRSNKGKSASRYDGSSIGSDEF